MKKHLILLFFVMFSAMLPEVASASNDKFLERQKVLGKWMKAAEKTAGISHNKSVNAVVNFLKDGLYIAAPYPNDQLAAKVLESKKYSQVAVIPIVGGDELVSNAWRESCDSNFASLFLPNPSMPMLILKDNIKMSDTWKSLVLIHEGSHAMAFVVGAFVDISNSSTRHAVDEYYAYSLEFVALDAVGGPMYRTVLDQEVKKIEQSYRKGAQLELPDYKQAYKLNIVFGLPRSETEMGIRWSTLWLNAVFKAIDNVYGTSKKSDQLKIDFLYSSYSTGTMK